MDETHNLDQSQTRTAPLGPLLKFAGCLAALEVLRLGLGFLSFPKSLLPLLDLLMAAIFLAVPIIAIYLAGSFKWKPSSAIVFILAGVAVQALAIFLNLKVFHGRGIAAGLAVSVSQMGLQTWCVGLGALLGSSVREKNILIPVAIFLVFFDVFLVLTPVGPTQQLMQNTQILQNAGLQIPKPTAGPTTGKVAAGGFIGPADLVFLGAFLVSIFRFGMRAVETFRALLITLVCYLFFVFATGIALPALVPIGVVTLFVNRKEFFLTKDEWASTGVIVLLGFGMLAYGFSQRRAKLPVPRVKPPVASPVGPSNSGPSPTVPAPASSPKQASQGQH